MSGRNESESEKSRGQGQRKRLQAAFSLILYTFSPLMAHSFGPKDIVPMLIRDTGGLSLAAACRKRQTAKRACKSLHKMTTTATLPRVFSAAAVDQRPTAAGNALCLTGEKESERQRKREREVCVFDREIERAFFLALFVVQPVTSLLHN